MKRKIMTVFVAAISIIALAGCSSAKVEEPAPAPADKQAAYEEEDPEEHEDYEDEEEYEEYPEDEYYDDEIPEEEELSDEEDDQDDLMAAGVWYTDGYDEENNWADSYKIELSADGKATCTGWRNKDTGTYETEDGKVFITFDHCETDTPGEGFKPVDGFEYTIEMDINGDDAKIKIDAPDVISNLTDGTVHRRSDDGITEEGDAGEGADIADGVYITDATYKGDISSDGATLSIETALNHEDENWNTVQDYEKRTYVFSTSKDCKCVIYQEDKEEYPVAEQVDFINDFLKGNSELPITLKIKNNELVEIGFSS